MTKLATIIKWFQDNPPIPPIPLNNSWRYKIGDLACVAWFFSSVNLALIGVRVNLHSWEGHTQQVGGGGGTHRAHVSQDQNISATLVSVLYSHSTMGKKTATKGQEMPSVHVERAQDPLATAVLDFSSSLPGST